MKVKKKTHQKTILTSFFFSNPGMFYFVNQQQNMGINLFKKVQEELSKRVLKSSILFCDFPGGSIDPLWIRSPHMGTVGP